MDASETRKPDRCPVRLADYAPPDHLLDTVALEIDIGAEDATVAITMTGRRNPAATASDAPLHLDGEAQELLEIVLDGRVLAPGDYSLDDTSLRVPGIGDTFSVTVRSRNFPAGNSTLEGLYLSNGMYCTQCEAEGFRRIAFFPDRPDVMAVYTTTIRADRARCPVVLSNGNPVAAGDLGDGRHFATWHDPFPKPSYLFAMVAGDLAAVEDIFTTRSGRTVTLRIFVEPGDESRCSHAMASLKRAMKWDETRFGLEYDLDLFMIVAVSHFNMGAMENKGLNIFNSRYILADHETATDTDFQRIEEIVAHEYFHNWTGNRVTCRDWFQLSLKEGLTVFRDQEYTADTQSRGAKRVADARFVRSVQFAEDAGPSAHPVRPAEYQAIDNFYTTTVYEKGAEVVRLIHTRIGETAFQSGLTLYLERHDGQAATCEDFIAAMQEASGLDLADMMLWYDQAGTPEITVSLAHDSLARRATLSVTQSMPACRGEAERRPMPIPLAVGMLDSDGRELPLRLQGDRTNSNATTRMLMVCDARQSFVFEDIAAPPVASLLRGFSAPVRVKRALSIEEMVLLMEHDSDPFARWDAGQRLATQLLLDLVSAQRKGQAMVVDPAFVTAIRANLTGGAMEPAVRAEMLGLPSEGDLALAMDEADVDAIHAARSFLVSELGSRLFDDFRATYSTCLSQQQPGDMSAEAMGLRSLGNAALGYLAASGRQEGRTLAQAQIDGARSMTFVMGGLRALNDIDCPERAGSLAHFHDRWRHRPMELDKWFALTASSSLPSTLMAVQGLLRHPGFDLQNPNRVRAVAGSFSAGNPVRFHTADGAGYRFLSDLVMKLDQINPQGAARLVKPLTQWRHYDRLRQTLMTEELRRIAAVADLSKNTVEIVHQGLAEAGTEAMQ